MIISINVNIKIENNLTRETNNFKTIVLSSLPSFFSLIHKAQAYAEKHPYIFWVYIMNGLLRHCNAIMRDLAMSGGKGKFNLIINIHLKVNVNSIIYK